MQQSIGWTCIVIGGLLILTAVLSGIFKFNILGASVEGQSQWGQKILAFFAGVIFVTIGTIFHGVEIYLTHNKSDPSSIKQPSQAGIFPPIGERHDVPLPNPTQSAVMQKPGIDISGIWKNEERYMYKIAQDEDDLEIICLNPEGGTIGEGTGIITGRTAKLKLVIGGAATGTCEMRLLTNARKMTGSCTVDIIGISDDTIWNKIE